MKYTIGFEIHKQIDHNKLFCNCSSISSNKTNINSNKKIELVDIFNDTDLQYKEYKYKVSENICNYEIDELPPVLNRKILEKALEIAKTLNFKLLNPLIIMRKRILDGSIPSGYQKSILIGYGGHIIFQDKKYSLEQIYLEEDSGIKNNDYFNLERLGIPLIEITSSVFKINEDVENTSFFIELLKIINNTVNLFEVPRGIGTVREDINISTGNGKVELKGVQNISSLNNIIKEELKRQNSVKNGKLQIILLENNIISVKSENKSKLEMVLEFINSKNICFAKINLSKCMIYCKNEKSLKIILKKLNLYKQDNFYETRRVLKNLKSQYLRTSLGIKRLMPETDLGAISYDLKNIKILDVKWLNYLKEDIKDIKVINFFLTFKGRKAVKIFKKLNLFTLPKPEFYRYFEVYNKLDTTTSFNSVEFITKVLEKYVCNKINIEHIKYIKSYKGDVIILKSEFSNFEIISEKKILEFLEKNSLKITSIKYLLSILKKHYKYNFNYILFYNTIIKYLNKIKNG